MTHNPVKKVNIKTKYLERIEITGPVEEFSEQLDFLNKNGYTTTKSGPVQIKNSRVVDMSKFCIVGERDISEEIKNLYKI